MSEMLLSFLIALGILALLFAFVPMLHICNSGCQRFFGRTRTAKRLQETEPAKESRGLGEAA